jgi:glycosyltransferase involved in cell wall biosynthesis
MRSVHHEDLNKNMRIAVIAKTRLKIAEPFRGGLEAFTYAVCKEYMKQGHEVTLYAHGESDPSLNVVSFYGSEFRDSDYFELYENDEYIKILQDIELKGYDIVHNNSTHELPIIWGAKASIPVITTLHTPPISKLKAAIALSSSSDNLSFVSISQAFNESWAPFLRNGSSIIYNGIDTKLWPRVRERSDYLFWYGRMVPAKGLDIALDAAHGVGIPLHFAGPIDDTKYFETTIQPKMHGEDVYLGHLDQPQILQAMRGAAATVSSVRWQEPFGLTNIEAMSAGVPIAGFNRGAFSEIVNQESGTIADELTVVSMIAAIRKAMLLESEIVSKQAQRFSLQSMVERYVELFEVKS